MQSEKQEFNGPKEDNNTQRDCTAGQRPANKVKQGRRHKGENEEEHWGLKEELHTWDTLAHMKGWQGVWEPAKQTENKQDGVTGRSG
eukprot:5883073-Heterocapsa_arctica.AAC.1